MTSVEQALEAEATKEELRVDIDLRPEIAEHAGDELRELLLAYVRELVDSLGIPAEPVVALASSPDAADRPDPYTIRVGGRACAPRLPLDVAADAPAEDLIEAIAGSITANRELLLTPTIADRLAREWNARSPLVARVGLTPDAFTGLLVDLLRRCVSVAPRALGPPERYDEVGEPRIDSLDGLREAILDAGSAPSITIFVEPRLLAAPAENSSSSGDYDLSVLGSTLQELFVEELGLLLPAIQSAADPGLPAGRFRIQVNDLRFAPVRGLLAGEVLVPTSVEDLEGRGLTARAATNPTQGGEAAVVGADESVVAALKAHGYFTVSARGYVAFAARRALRGLAGSFLRSDLLMFQLNRLRDDDPVVVDAALERFDHRLLTAVFRRLLDEQVPIRNAVAVLEGMLAIGPGVSIDQSLYEVVAPEAASMWSVPDGSGLDHPGASEYVECVRRHLRWALTRSTADDGNQIQALRVDRRLESRIRRPSEPLDDDERERLRNAVWAVYERFARTGSGIVVVTNSEVRHELKRLLEPTFPELQVLSRHEIAPGAELRWKDEIAWA